jgi:hypothetical protein
LAVVVAAAAGLAPGSGSAGLPVDVVVGVDTHAQTHTVAFCDGRGGQLLAVTVSSDLAGAGVVLAVLAALVADLDAPRVVIGIEGSGSYGAGLTQDLTQAGMRVLEIRGARRPRGVPKNDLTDALAIARMVLTQLTSVDLAERVAQPRTGHLRGALAVVVTARAKHVAQRTALHNHFHGQLFRAPAAVRQELRGHTYPEQVRLLAGRRPRPVLPADLTGPKAAAQAAAFEVAQVYAVLAAVASTITHLDEVIKAFDKVIDKITAKVAAPLRAELGVGPISTAAFLIGYSHDRFRCEGAFAALAGVAPLEASSGRTIRHRLNRGGDRQLNAALHRVVITRRRCGHQPTTDYIARCANSPTPKSDREITRCLKRYVARSVYRILRSLPPIP